MSSQVEMSHQKPSRPKSLYANLTRLCIRWLRRAVQIIPISIRYPLYRLTLNVELELPAELTVEIARSQEDLEEAFRLLHDAYASAGLMKPDPSVQGGCGPIFGRAIHPVQSWDGHPNGDLAGS